jgi:hypothetical protein
MSDQKLSKFEIAKAFALLWAIAMVFVVINQAVLNVFWRLVLKLIDKIVSR